LLRTTRTPRLAVGILAVALLAACSTPTPALTPAPTAAAFSPVTVDNCGVSVVVAKPPKRIITIKSTSTELLLALGLGKRIIGSAFSDGPVPKAWAAAASAIPVISKTVPSEEAVLNLNPDFIFAGWESNLSDQGAGDRGSLHDLGVGSYVSPAACKEPGYKPTKLSFDNVFSYILEAGKIFGAPTEAAALVEQQKTKLASITPDTSGLSALWYSSGDDTPYVGAGIGAPEMMLDALGLRNIAADVNDTWTPLSWEAVVAANPDVIVLVDASWNTADSKIASLESNPATANLDAVKNHRYLTIPFAASEAGVRNVDATVDLAAQLKKLESQ
jgi:iron complex transport system substrate-binding protein